MGKYCPRIEKWLIGVIITALCMMFSSTPAWAKYRIHFKNGSSKVVNHYKQEGNSIKIFQFGGVFTYPKSSIREIEDMGGAKAPAAQPAASSEAPRKVEAPVVVAPPPAEGSRPLESLIYIDAANPESRWVPFAGQEGVFIQKGIYGPGDKISLQFMEQGGVKKKILKITAEAPGILPAQVIYSSPRPEWDKNLTLPSEKEQTGDYLNAGKDEVIANLVLPPDFQPRDFELKLVVENLVAVKMEDKVQFLEGPREKKVPLHIAYPNEKLEGLTKIAAKEATLIKATKRKVLINRLAIIGGVILALLILIALILVSIKKIRSQMSRRPARGAAASNKKKHHTPDGDIQDFMARNLFAVVGEDRKLESNLRPYGTKGLAALQTAIENSQYPVQGRALLARILGQIGGSLSGEFLVQKLDELSHNKKQEVLTIGIILGLGLAKDKRALPKLQAIAQEGGKLGEFADKSIQMLEGAEEKAEPAEVKEKDEEQE